jgi:hypothetical protein
MDETNLAAASFSPELKIFAIFLPLKESQVLTQVDHGIDFELGVEKTIGQLIEPVERVYVPVGHALQFLAPLSAAYLPVAHKEQLVEPFTD